MLIARLGFVLVTVVGVVSFASACQDPCVTLAQRICDCEKTSPERQACRTDRIVNQQSSVATTQADQDFCTKALETCTCAALDNNNLDACGFAPEKTK